MSREYIIEYFTLGNSVKVSAIDAETGKEVSIIGATTQGREELARVAVQKLEYVLSKLDK